MVKKFTLFLFIISILVTNTFSQNVSLANAQKIAKNFLAEKGKKPVAFKGTKEDTFRKAGVAYFYALQLEDKGFVIVSADTLFYPVIGYSTKNDLSLVSDNPAFNSWMNMYTQQIDSAKKDGYKQSAVVKQQWKKYLSDESATELRSTNAITSAVVGPLLGTDGDPSAISFNQKTYYDDACPNESMVGCVGTAMSQIMVYHQFPDKGVGYRQYNHYIADGYYNDFGLLSADFGETTYNIATLPPNLSEANEDLSRLLYHAGLSVLTNYDPLGSSTTTSRTCNALATNWSYDKSVGYYKLNNFPDTTEWENRIKANIDSGLPIIYRGVDEASGGGHAWICDGYDSNNNMYHMNWGWGGADNGFYLLTALDPTGKNYILSQGAIFDIKPDTSSIKTLVWEDFELGDAYYYLTPGWNSDGDDDGNIFGGYLNGIDESYAKIGNKGKVNQWLISPRIKPTADRIIEFSLWAYRTNSYDQKIEVYVSTDSTNIDTDFSLVETFNLTDSWAEYAVDLSAYAGQLIYLGLKATGSESGGFSFMYIDNMLMTATPEDLETPIQETLIEASDLIKMIGPNPTNGQLQIVLNKEIASVDVSVIDMSGKSIFDATYTDERIILDLPEKEGVYFVRVRAGKEIETHKIIKK